MNILVINGPNLNLLGIREKEIYGSTSYQDLLNLLEEFKINKNINIDIKQSNYEGKLIDYIQEAYGKYDGIVINPAGYTHTSIVILDALKAVNIPTVEVHISDISKREQYRKISYIKDYCVASVIGKGINGYIEAIEILMKELKK